MFYDKVLQSEPMNMKAYYNRGGAQNEIRMFISAIRDFDKVIEINPNYA